MAEKILEIVQHKRVARPIDVVRAQALDFRHHIAAGVHRGIHYTILSQENGVQRVRQQFRVLGMRKTDELEAYAAADGTVIQDFLAGDFAGGRITLRLVAEGASATRMEAHLRAPLRGMNRLLAPVIHRVVVKLTAQTLEEDRRDLEEGNYRQTS